MAGRVPFPQRLPGTYWDIRSEIVPMAPASVRGTVIDMMPMTWFNENEVVDIHNREWRSLVAVTKVGTSAALAAPKDDIFARDVQRRLLALLESGMTEGEPFGAILGKIFPQNIGGAKASAVQGVITWRAKKNGTTGNKITVNIIEQDGAYTITTFFNAQRMYVQRIYELNQLEDVMRDNELIEAEITNPAGIITLGEVNLTGGGNGTIPAYNTRLQAFLDAASMKNWHCISLAIAPGETGYADARTAFRSWLVQLNRDLQENRHGVVFGLRSDTNAGMDNFNIDVVTQDLQWNSDYWIGHENAVRLFAGRYAGAANNRTTASRAIQNVTAVRPEYTIRQREDCYDRGLQAVTETWDGRWMLEDDINSFVSWVPEFNLQWRLNQTMRGIHDTMVRWNRIFISQHKNRTQRNQRGLEKVLGDVDNLFYVLETEEVMTEHDISKIEVLYNDTDPQGVIIRARNILYVNAIARVDFDMRISWARN